MTARFRQPDPLFVVLVALLCASVLVIYLHQRVLQDVDRVQLPLHHATKREWRGMGIPSKEQV